MPPSKPKPTNPLPSRERVLAAAERLLGSGSAEFSMRELAAEAGVSFATPFNQFGSKTAIMQALSEKRIALMHERLTVAAAASGNAATRTLMAAEIAAQVMLETPSVNRAVMAVLGAPTQAAGDVLIRSRALWTAALGDGDGLQASRVDLAFLVLPDKLAFAFRGVLSFWTAGEITDNVLVPQARAAAAALLMGFAAKDTRTQLEAVMRAPANQIITSM